MKSKHIIFASALLFSAITFAQKDQIKAAEKALKSGNSSEAKTILLGAESLIANATPAEKAQFFFVKANTLMDLVTKKVDADNNQEEAAKAYLNVLDTEKTSGKSKYSDQAKVAIATIKDKLIAEAINAEKSEKYAESSKLLKLVYDLDKSDLEKLFFSANDAYVAKLNDNALMYFQELKSKNYTGESTSYFAKNVLNDKEEYFGNDAEAKKMREDRIKLKLYTTPREEKTPSRKPQIVKNIAFLLSAKGDKQAAIESIKEARTENPDDINLITTQADLYYELKDIENYKKTVTEALAKNPNDAVLLYNLGVLSSRANQAVDAEKYFKRAIEINPKYFDAYSNLAELKLNEDEKYIAELKKLTSSEKDNKRFAVIRAEQYKIYNSALPYLEKAYEINPKDNPIATTLLSVYRALEMTDKAKALKEKLK